MILRMEEREKREKLSKVGSAGFEPAVTSALALSKDPRLAC
jgi:hypothetical protein